METIKDVLEKIKFIEWKVDQLLKRLDELDLIMIWCEMVWRSKASYVIEYQMIKSQINFLEKDIKKLRSKQIVWIDGEVE